MPYLPLVSIIIPTYNRERIIGTAINSVLKQTYTEWECLVIDDGSRDNSWNVLKAYQEQDHRIHIYKRERLPKGAPTCRNIGLEHTKGKYVVFLDSDDYLLPFCLEQRIAMFKEYNTCDFLVFPMGEQKEKVILKKEIPKSKDYLVNFLSANLPWSIMCPIWKSTFLKQLNGFTEGYPRFNDPELMIRALVRPNIEFKVFIEDHYDSVYIPSSKKNTDFNDKVYHSLLMFVPDICKVLNAMGKPNYKRYLSNYLHLWFKYFYIPIQNYNTILSFKLIVLFYRERIISLSKALNLFVRLSIFSFTKLFFKLPIDKLTEKTIYIK